MIPCWSQPPDLWYLKMFMWILLVKFWTGWQPWPGSWNSRLDFGYSSVCSYWKQNHSGKLLSKLCFGLHFLFVVISLTWSKLLISMATLYVYNWNQKQDICWVLIFLIEIQPLEILNERLYSEWFTKFHLCLFFEKGFVETEEFSEQLKNWLVNLSNFLDHLIELSLSSDISSSWICTRRLASQL